MLGEAAMTAADARRYYEAYERAIHAIGAAAAGARRDRRPGHLDQALGAAPALLPSRRPSA
jgi:proline dehydrogenase